MELIEWWVIDSVLRSWICVTLESGFRKSQISGNEVDLRCLLFGENWAKLLATPFPFQCDSVCILSMPSRDPPVGGRRAGAGAGVGSGLGWSVSAIVVVVVVGVLFV